MPYFSCEYKPHVHLIMSEESENNVFYKIRTMNQKRKTNGYRTNEKLKSMMMIISIVLTILSYMTYVIEGALVQPTLSFTTSGSQQSGKKLILYNNKFESRLKRLYKTFSYKNMV